MRVSGLAIVGAGSVLLAVSGPAEAQQNFDGRWSVLVLTEKGECDKAYRYPVAIENGRVRYVGDAPFDISGQVAANGAVQSNIMSGQTRVAVRGRLSGASGSGTWVITGGRNCSGSWSAEKRG